jgi:hypothetical protein
LIFFSLVLSGLGLVVLLDIVHSYASADELVGLSLFDGSNDCYFHSGIEIATLFYTIENFSSYILLSIISEKTSISNSLFFIDITWEFKCSIFSQKNAAQLSLVSNSRLSALANPNWLALP